MTNAGHAARLLLLLGEHPVPAILEALESSADSRAELRQKAGLAANAGLRTLARMLELGAIEKQRRNRFPGTVEYALTAAGQDLLGVCRAIEDWLELAPGGPLRLGGDDATAVVAALAESWESGMLRQLAEGPRTLTDLDRSIESLSYPSLERRLAAMRAAALVTPLSPRRNHRTPHELTSWARESLDLLTAAVRWEQRHDPAQVALG